MTRGLLADRQVAYCTRSTVQQAKEAYCTNSTRLLTRSILFLREDTPQHHKNTTTTIENNDRTELTDDPPDPFENAATSRL